MRPSQLSLLLGPFPMSELSQGFGYHSAMPSAAELNSWGTPCPAGTDLALAGPELALVTRPPSPEHQQ